MSPVASVPGWEVVDFSAIPGTACPCGSSHRGLMNAADVPFSIHRVKVSVDARPHYHRRMTETYCILECQSDARLELDDTVLPLRPGLCVVIRPGVRHCARGRMTILNIVVPKFDPRDEWFD
jgi:mannose-6-phosphate isomerase-like protein (cupin superfamily)